MFCFTQGEYNLIKLQLYNNWSGPAVNSILKCAMLNSKKPIKFAYPWKLAKQSMLNKAHAIEIKVMILKVDKMYSLLRKSFGDWSNDERREAWSKLLMVFTFEFRFICYLGKNCK